MNKELNNWLDKVEGLPENTTNNNIKREMKIQGYNCSSCGGNDWKITKVNDCEDDYNCINCK